jgi:hypothetical protein
MAIIITVIIVNLNDSLNHACKVSPFHGQLLVMQITYRSLSILNEPFQIVHALLMVHGGLTS